MKLLRLSFLFVLVLSSMAINAQAYFGARVGLNATNASIDVANAEIDTDGQTNLAIGAFVTLPILGEFLSIQPELTYLNRGYSFEATVLGGSIEQTLAFVDVGALVRLAFAQDNPVGFYVGAGPYYSYALSGTVTEFGDDRDVDFDADRLNRGELQVAGVAGVTFGSDLKFFAEFRYQGSLSNQSDADDVDINQRSIGLNGGIMVPLGN